MLFSSFEFIFIFLPIIIILFIFFNKKNRNIFSFVIIIFSLYFYSFSNSSWLLILVFSIIFNFLVGKSLIKNSSKLILFLGIFSNLLVLIYFKYTNFFLENLNNFFSIKLNYLDIILPIGISFFTFQQIAFLIDANKKKIKNPTFINYSLFVSFFPQLIAGPIILYGDIIKQLEKKTFLDFLRKIFLLVYSYLTLVCLKKCALQILWKYFQSLFFTKQKLIRLLLLLNVGVVLFHTVFKSISIFQVIQIWQ